MHQWTGCRPISPTPVSSWQSRWWWWWWSAARQLTGNGSKLDARGKATITTAETDRAKGWKTSTAWQAATKLLDETGTIVLHQKKFCELAWHFTKFHGSTRQTSVNSTADSRLIENQLCCSKYPINIVSVNCQLEVFTTSYLVTDWTKCCIRRSRE